MHTECSLIARGYRADFRFTLAEANRLVDLEVGIGLADGSQRLATSTAGYIPVNDIVRLARYFEDHLASLARNPDTQSEGFVPLELNFELQAMEGEVRAGGDGEFTLRVMVNVTGTGSPNGSVYVGCEGVIDAAHVRDFTTRLHELASQFAADGRR
ncbi:hypothetical protein [Stigmatella hybrida]|uniref:hypothetical protein n=1 Tax=Stigmatella hybrida TaxID=394097 RepID=UPI001CDB378D|nr:hypothetical protein [Stigmatella hybrida]